MINNKEQNIVLSGTQSLARYNSDLIKKGLSLAHELQHVNQLNERKFSIFVNQYSEAVADLDEEIQELIDNQGQKDDEQEIAQSFMFRMGNFYYESGDYEEAINAYTQVLQVNPDYTDAF